MNKSVRSQFSSIKLDQLVYVELESGNGGMMLTVSEEGFSFRAVSPVRAISRTAFSFVINGTQKLEGFGKIDWTKDDGKVAGLQFVDVTTDFLVTLRAWLTQLCAPAAPLSYNDGSNGISADTAYASPASDSHVQDIQREHEFSVVEDMPLEQPSLDRAAADRSSAAEPPRRTPNPAVSELRLNLGQPVFNAQPSSAQSLLNAQPVLNTQSTTRVASREFSPAPAPVLSEWSYPAAQTEKAGRSGTAIAAAVGLVLLAVVLYTYRGALGQSLISLGQKMSNASVTTDADSPKTPEAPTTPVQAPAQSTSETPAPSTHNDSQPQSGSLTDSRFSAPVGSATKPDSTFQDARPGATPTDVSKDNGASRDPQDQVRSLWSAVSQGNTTAEVTLAKLYLIGGGVPKSCDQAKVLLQAAAKKGNGEAIDKLSQISQQGCPR